LKIKYYFEKANFKAETIHQKEEPIHEKTKINSLTSKKSIAQQSLITIIKHLIIKTE
jgi:hypothetical protein